MLLGNIVDCLLLTPEEFDKKYIVEFDKSKHEDALKTVSDMLQFLGLEKQPAKSKKADLISMCKEQDHKVKIFDEIALEHYQGMGDRTEVTIEQYQTAEAICEAIKTNPKTKWLYESTTQTQVKITYVDKKTGLRVIMYLDAVSEHEGKAIVWDLKTTTNASEDRYPRQAADLYYHLQSAMYCLGYFRKKFVFPDFYQVVAETKPPYAVNTYKASQDFLEAGKQLYRNNIDKVKYCIDNDCFDKGYDFLDELGWDELDLPGYLKKKFD